MNTHSHITYLIFHKKKHPNPMEAHETSGNCCHPHLHAHWLCLAHKQTLVHLKHALWRSLALVRSKSCLNEICMNLQVSHSSVFFHSMIFPTLQQCLYEICPKKTEEWDTWSPGGKFIIERRSWWHTFRHLFWGCKTIHPPVVSHILRNNMAYNPITGQKWTKKKTYNNGIY